MGKVLDRRYIVVDGNEYPVKQWHAVNQEIVWSERLASYRSGIEQILELHGEDFIKTRLRKLLEI